MTRDEFKALTDKGVVLLDGATGSNMTKAGMPKGTSTELWILDHPEPLQELQRVRRWWIQYPMQPWSRC